MQQQKAGTYVHGPDTFVGHDKSRPVVSHGDCMRFFLLILGLAATSSFLGAAATAQQPSTRQIPAFTAYSEPDAEAIDFPDAGPVNAWSDVHNHLVWYGILRHVGALRTGVNINLPVDEEVMLSMEVDHGKRSRRVVRGTGALQSVDFGTTRIAKAGPHSFHLFGIHHSGKTFGSIIALELAGPAAGNALFNTTPQRGAPSVHLTYTEPKDAQIEWFYNEVTVRKAPVWSYYEACGFTRGYFGIQVNSPTERRIIFSVWDSSAEKDERANVAAQDRVQLLAKGPSVFAGDFGHEGTGGHSHLVYPWKTGKTYRFLLHAHLLDKATIYTAYFFYLRSITGA